MKKRYIAMLMVLVVLLSACGTALPAPENTTTAQTQGTEMTQSPETTQATETVTEPTVETEPTTAATEPVQPETTAPTEPTQQTQPPVTEPEATTENTEPQQTEPEEETTVSTEPEITGMTPLQWQNACNAALKANGMSGFVYTGDEDDYSEWYVVTLLAEELTEENAQQYADYYTQVHRDKTVLFANGLGCTYVGTDGNGRYVFSLRTIGGNVGPDDRP